MAGKYSKLAQHLMGLGVTRELVTLQVQEIEMILGFALPPSASRHGAWWANTSSHPHAEAWMRAGFLVDGFSLGEWVRLRHVGVHGGAPAPSSRGGRSVTSGQHAFLQPQTSAPLKLKYPSSGEGTVALISCTKTKTSVPNAARELYTSAWFRKAMAFVEKQGMPFLILSAKHGLVHPDTVLAPYELTLKKMAAPARRAWADQVTDQLLAMTPKVRKCVILAAREYREHLVHNLSQAGIEIEVPMEGLTQGWQLHWLDGH